MNILIVSFYYAPELGAAPSRIANMARGLAAKGNQVEVLTCLPNYPKGRIFEGYRHRFSKHEQNEDGIRIHRYWTYTTISKNPLKRILSMLSYSLTLWTFSRHIRRIRRFDLVIVQSPPIMVACSAMLLFRKVFRRKVLLNVSDLWPLSAVELGAVREGTAYHRILLAMEQFAYRNAVAVQGQSQEILKHIGYSVPGKPTFLYRNLQPTMADSSLPDAFRRHRPFRIVYAGLLGVAQDLMGIIEQIDFKQLGAELHLFGGGNQAEQIEAYISQHDCGVSYHGYLPKDKMVEELRRYDASIVPLARQIYGAVPSKIFDLLPVGVPILLCGSGEAASIVKQYGIGMVASPSDIDMLRQNIVTMAGLSDEDYADMKRHCLEAAMTVFSFEHQMENYQTFLSKI